MSLVVLASLSLPSLQVDGTVVGLTTLAVGMSNSNATVSTLALVTMSDGTTMDGTAMLAGPGLDRYTFGSNNPLTFGGSTVDPATAQSSAATLVAGTAAPTTTTSPMLAGIQSTVDNNGMVFYKGGGLNVS